jgi:outer membrane protein OmpA-like peptidoglycan-associated protein
MKTHCEFFPSAPLKVRMKPLRIKRTAVAVALGIAFAQMALGDDETGKRVDNARVDHRVLPSSGEIQPAFGYPLPSGISRSEANAMREANRNLPARDAEKREAFSEQLGDGSYFASGSAELTDLARRSLREFAAPFKGRTGIKLAVVGHTDNQRLSANSRKRYPDNQALSEARAMAVADFLRRELDISAVDSAISGQGELQPIASNATPAGMARNRRVELSIWFDQAARSVPAVAVERAPCAPTSAMTADSPFTVTVDGEPLDLEQQPLEADRQRCTDVALEKANIQVRFDSLAVSPGLNAWAWPNAVVRGEAVELLVWSNYLPWIKRAELRLFRAGQKPQENPLEILPVTWQQPNRWTPPTTPDDEYFFLLRVYDADGRFDETSLKPLKLIARSRPLADRDSIERERLIGYGENSLALRNIPVSGGTVTVNGSQLKPGQHVEALGQEVPVDANGRFAMKQIMPAGAHSVEVKVRDEDGSVNAFRRNLSIAKDDWFYIALGDLTIGENRTAGPVRLVTSDTQHYEDKVYVDGRAAFYLKGKVKGDWILTASADTREQPLENLFTNFTSKDPRYLLRNINPDLYYPVYGDDSTTVDDAPTQGKFFVRLEKGESQVMWGNFQTAWSGTELLQYSRTLYGARARYRSEETTAYGEKRSMLDAFAAEPGTLAARDEFRGTGGSLYYLRHQDITMGSERIWAEVRDKDSGLVIQRRLLTAAQDYEINYLQGRVLLTNPLSSTATDGSLILSSALSGNPTYLVTTYEFVPGLTAVDNLAKGARFSHWVNDYFQFGLTGYHQGEKGSTNQTLRGFDATVRYRPGTFVKVESAESNGAGTGSLSSQDGGFGFNDVSTAGGRAKAQRVEASVDLAEVTEGGRGRLSAYAQNRERGFSAPGQIVMNGEAAKQVGVKGALEVMPGTTLEAKADVNNTDTMDASNTEVAVRQRLNDEWQVSVGARHDNRTSSLANASSILSQNGRRTDGIVRADYRPLREGGAPGQREDWEVYGFGQGTLERSGNRDANNRAGVGGGYMVNERLKLLAEASDGNLGWGGRLGADYRLSERSNVYMNYLMETENPNVAWRGRQGTWVSGSATRLSDELRVFGEVRAVNGAGPQSLINAFGLDLAPNDRWSFGIKGEVGTVSDPLAGDLNRHAMGFSAAYKERNFKYSGNVEWREDESNLSGTRTTWLVRNTVGYQATPAWRLLGKANWSTSSNTQGAFYDGDFHEFVAGAAYRPVDNDRWNTLFKYTNFNNVPTSGQLTATGQVADYAQRSQVFAVDTIYDVTPWLAVGGKYAFRIGELKANKTDGDWFSSRADLIVLRADFHWVREWDAMVEARQLRAQEADDARSGFLLALYRHLGQGVKAGVGYNFTNYSDDLTDLSYRSRGWFLNVIGTM